MRPKTRYNPLHQYIISVLGVTLEDETKNMPKSHPLNGDFHGNIVIAESNPLIAELMKEALTRTGFRVGSTFHDAQTLLDYTKSGAGKTNGEPAERLTVILSDSLKGTDAAELVAWMKVYQPQVVTILTCVNSPPSRTELGSFDFVLRKPFGTSQLIEAVLAADNK